VKKSALFAFILFLGLTLAATLANAAPFVVCDPYPLETALTDTDPPNPEYFIVVFDTGTPVTAQPTLDANGRIYLKYDLVSVAKGKHIVRVKAGHSVWGESVEVPFTFRAGTPKAATGVGLLK